MLSLRIRTKIFLSFGSVIILLSFLGFLTYYNRNLLFKSITGLESEINKLAVFNNLQQSVNLSVMPPNDYLITGDKGEEEHFNKIAVDVRKSLDQLEVMVENGEKKEIGHNIKESFGRIEVKAAQIFSLDNPIGNKNGMRLMKEIDEIASDITQVHLNQYYSLIHEQIGSQIEKEEFFRKKVDQLLIFGVIVSAALIIFVILYLFNSIIRPILLFTSSAQIVGRGNLDHKIEIKDGIEMNDLAYEFNTMAGKLKDSYASLENKVELRTKELNEANRKLKELSLTDGLTGIFNKRHFNERLTAEIKRAARYSKNVSLIMLDIDHFKHYNDVNGHPEGDKVLKGVADCLVQNVRDIDIVVRYGGEEFSVILPETDKKEAMVIAERIRSFVAIQPFANKENQPGGNLTVSQGISCYPEDAPEAEGLIEKADIALYVAKNKGRNRVETFNHPL